MTATRAIPRQQNWHWAVKTVSICFRAIKKENSKKKESESHHTLK